MERWKEKSTFLYNFNYRIVGVVCLIAGLAVFIILIIQHQWQY